MAFRVPALHQGSFQKSLGGSHLWGPVASCWSLWAALKPATAAVCPFRTGFPRLLLVLTGLPRAWRLCDPGIAVLTVETRDAELLSPG